MRSALAWAGTFLRLSFREAQLALLFILMTPFFVLVIQQTYGAAGFAKSLSVIVLTDGGAAGSEIVHKLESSSWEGRATMTVYESRDRDAAFAALRTGRVCLVADAAGAPERVVLYADSGEGMGAYAEGFVREALHGGAGPAVAYEGGTGTSRDFLYALPGLLVFGGTFGGLTLALLLARELRRGTVDRVRLTGSGPAGLFAGLLLAQAAMGILQFAAGGAAAAALGFPPPSSWSDVLVCGAAANVLLAALCAAAAALTVSWARSESSAANLSFLFIAPLAFLSGSLIPIRGALFVRVLGMELAWNDLLPTAPISTALTRVLVGGEGIAAVAPHLALAAAETLVLCAAASHLFDRRVLKAAKVRNRKQGAAA